MGMMPLKPGPISTDNQPDTPSMDIVNGDFQDGLAGWNWYFIADSIGSFTAEGQAEAVTDNSLHIGNIVMRLKNSVVIPAPQFDSAFDESLPTPGPRACTDREADASIGPAIICVTNAEQRFTYIDGDVLAAFTSVSFGIELARATDLRLTVVMSLVNLTTGNTFSTSILDHTFVWPGETLVAIDGQTGWQVHQIDVAECGVVPGDLLDVRFSLQAAISDPTPETVVQIFSQTRIDDVIIYTQIEKQGTPIVRADCPNRRVSIHVQPIGDLADRQAHGGPRSADGLLIETDNVAIIELSPGEDAGEGRIHLGSDGAAPNGCAD